MSKIKTKVVVTKKSTYVFDAEKDLGLYANDYVDLYAYEDAIEAAINNKHKDDFNDYCEKDFEVEIEDIDSTMDGKPVEDEDFVRFKLNNNKNIVMPDGVSNKKILVYNEFNNCFC